MSVTYPGGEQDTWLDPRLEDAAAPAVLGNNPNPLHAYHLAHYAIDELHKRITASAMKLEDRGAAAADAAPAYRDLVDLLSRGGVVPIDRQAQVQTALLAYQSKLRDAALKLLAEEGPQAIIILGDVEPYEPL